MENTVNAIGINDGVAEAVTADSQRICDVQIAGHIEILTRASAAERDRASVQARIEVNGISRRRIGIGHTDSLTQTRQPVSAGQIRQDHAGAGAAIGINHVNRRIDNKFWQRPFHGAAVTNSTDRARAAPLVDIIDGGCRTGRRILMCAWWVGLLR